MSGDIALIAVGWLALLWCLVPAGRLPLALQRLTVQPGSRVAELALTTGFLFPGLGVFHLIIGWTEHQPIWQRVFWYSIGFLVTSAAAAVLIDGPRSFVRHLLRRSSHRDTAEHRVPPKGRALR